VTGQTRLVSRSSTGAPADGNSFFPSMSADGRYVAFVSRAANLVAGDTNGDDDVFVSDLLTGRTVRASIATNGAQGNGGSGEPSISADGRRVAFSSGAGLVPGDTNAARDVFVRDLVAGTTRRVSVSSSGAQAADQSLNPAISADGNDVAYESPAANLVPEDTNAAWDVFVRDLRAGQTRRASVSSDGSQGIRDSRSPSLSGDGGRVAFASAAGNLVAADTNRLTDIFVRTEGPTGLSAPE
jgi:Tol biopolymer transport system component